MAKSGNTSWRFPGISAYIKHPPVIHLRKELIDPAFHWSLDFLMRELRTSRPGSSLVEQHLASLILIQALRVYLSEDSSGISAGCLLFPMKKSAVR